MTEVFTERVPTYIRLSFSLLSNSVKLLVKALNLQFSVCIDLVALGLTRDCLKFCTLHSK